jgi:hypothetical protein
MEATLFSIAIGPYVVRCQAVGVPSFFETLKETAALLDLDEKKPRDPGARTCFVSVTESASDKVILVATQACDPGPDGGFFPGIALVPETGVLFLGAGDTISAYDLKTPRLLWRDHAEAGFSGWARHGDVVVMSAELALGAWDIEARKLWTTFVEPPWSYAVSESGVVQLDVMGRRSSFSVLKGPAGP